MYLNMILIKTANLNSRCIFDSNGLLLWRGGGIIGNTPFFEIKQNWPKRMTKFNAKTAFLVDAFQTAHQCQLLFSSNV